MHRVIGLLILCTTTHGVNADDPRDVAAIDTAMLSVAIYADRADFHRLEQVFVDHESLSGNARDEQAHVP